MALLWRRRARGQSGAAAVEFALVVVPLTTVLFGLIQYGFFFWAYQGGNDAARSIARSVAVGGDATCADFTADATSQVNSLAGSLVSATRTYHKASANLQVGDTVTISVVFQSQNMSLPFVPLPNGGQVSATATVRVENIVKASPSDPDPADCS